jgi:hypothetical protein
MERDQAQHVASLNGAERPAPRCVVLLCPGQGLPDRLRQAFQRRGIRLQECSDPHAAMTTLCLLARPVNGRLSGARLILLVLEPQRQRHLDDLLAALKRYAPGVTCRAYRHDAEVKISPLHVEPREAEAHAPSASSHAGPGEAVDPRHVDAPAAESSQAASPFHTPTSDTGKHDETPELRTPHAAPSYPQQVRGGEPHLRLTAVDDLADETNPDSADDASRRDLTPEPLTAEELSMLLADDDEDEQAEAQEQ